MNNSLLSLRKFVAPEFVFGTGAARLTSQYVHNLGARRILLVTDPGLLQTPWPDMVLADLNASGIETALFADVSPNPRDQQVMDAADTYRAEQCDAIVALGGGSPMDLAKGLGIVHTNRRHILDFEGVDKVDRPGPPLICIPTTAGTSADVSQFAIVNDTTRRIKIAIVSKTTVPDISLIDPALTATMPPDLTAHTGLDALTHAIEAYVSNASSAVTDLFALNAIRLIGASLLPALDRPDDLEQRSNMMLASLEAGLAFSNAILGAVHAMAHSLGGRLDLPHGECNAILLDHVIEANFDSASGRYADIARTLGLDFPPDDDDCCLRVLLDAIRRLKQAAGVTRTLGRMGVSKAELAALSETAVMDPCMVTNPRALTPDEVLKIYEKAL